VLESAFEGEHTELISHGTTLAAGMIWFTVTTTEENAGVRLLRLSDQQRGYQQASVFVDDQFAGIWLQPLGNPHARWLEDTFELPAALTEGKSSLAIRLEPTLGAPAWSAARYRVLTKVGG